MIVKASYEETPSWVFAMMSVRTCVAVKSVPTSVKSAAGIARATPIEPKVFRLAEMVGEPRGGSDARVDSLAAAETARHAGT